MAEQEQRISIACVDDDPNVLHVVTAYLRSLPCDIRTFSNPRTCLQELKKHPADIVITDLSMPEHDGLYVLKTVKADSPSTEVIIATGDADKDSAIQAIRLGAFDFFEKPVDREDLLSAIRRTVQYRNAVQEREHYRKQVHFLSTQHAKQWGMESFVGQSAALKRVLTEIRSLHKSDKVPVLITGESGTGKELVAHAIHAGSTRSSHPFVPVNCSAIPDNLAESILFGHIKGSFTGATSDKKGSFELADGGTLFLDEIGDMLPVIQAKLLRVLEDGIVEPVGSARGKKLNVRVIAATNADLDQRVTHGKFRTDLFHRLAAFRIRTPPLRERPDDIPILARHFAELLSQEMGMPKPVLTDQTLDALAKYNFPGNVRELRNILERALLRSSGHPVEPRHFDLVPPPPPDPASTTNAKPEHANATKQDFPLNLKDLEILAIRRAMQQTGGNVTEAARLLGIGRTKLYRWLDKT